MDLREALLRRHQGGHDRALEGTRCGDDVFRLDHAVGGLDAEDVSLLAHGPDLDAAADRRLDLLRIGDEVVGHLFLGGEGVVVEAGKGQAGEAVVPGRAVGNEAFPAGGAPAFGDTGFFENEMGKAASAEVLAHRNARLTGADDERIHFFHCHAAFLPVSGAPAPAAVSGSMCSGRRKAPT